MASIKITISDKVVLVDDIWVRPEDAMSMIINQMIRTDVFSSHPDQTENEGAEQLLVGLLKTNVLSEKTKAIVRFHLASKTLLAYCEDEIDIDEFE